MLVHLALQILKNKELSLDEANQATEIILKHLNALPLHDIISIDDQNQLVIRGIPVDLEKAIKLRAHAVSALDNPALKDVFEQTAYVAVTLGIHKAETPTQLLFSRAALWYGQQVQKYLELLAQRGEQPPL